MEGALGLHQVTVVACCSERDIGDVAPAVCGDARRHLPGGLGIVERGTAAGGPQAGAARDIAALVPGRFRDVADGGGIPGPVGQVPVAATPVIELGPSHGNVVGSRSKAVYPRTRTAVGTGVAAAGGTGVARGNKGGDSLGRSLFPQVVVKTVFSRTHQRFTRAEAGAHHRRQVVIYDVLGGQVDSVGGSGALGNYEFDGGVLRHRPGPFHVQVGFAVFVRAEVTRIGAVHNYLHGIRGQPHTAPEGSPVGAGRMGAADNGDALACSVYPGGIKGVDVVYGCEIARREGVSAA